MADEQEGQVGFLINVDLRTEDAERKLETLAASIERKLREAVNVSAATLQGINKDLQGNVKSLKGPNGKTGKPAAPHEKIPTDTASLESKLMTLNTSMRALVTKIDSLIHTTTATQKAMSHTAPAPATSHAAPPPHIPPSSSPSHAPVPPPHPHPAVASPPTRAGIHVRNIQAQREQAQARRHPTPPPQARHTPPPEGYLTQQEIRAIQKLQKNMVKGSMGSVDTSLRLTPALQHVLNEINVSAMEKKTKGEGVIAAKNRVDAFQYYPGSADILRKKYDELMQRYKRPPRAKKTAAAAATPPPWRARITPFAQRRTIPAHYASSATRPGEDIGSEQLTQDLTDRLSRVHEELQNKQAAIMAMNERLMAAEAAKSQGAAKTPARAHFLAQRVRQRHTKHSSSASSGGAMPSLATPGGILGFTENDLEPIWDLVVSLLNSVLPKHIATTLKKKSSSKTGKLSGELQNVLSQLTGNGQNGSTSTTPSVDLTDSLTALTASIDVLNKTLLTVNKTWSTPTAAPATGSSEAAKKGRGHPKKTEKAPHKAGAATANGPNTTGVGLESQQIAPPVEVLGPPKATPLTQVENAAVQQAATTPVTPEQKIAQRQAQRLAQARADIATQNEIAKMKAEAKAQQKQMAAQTMAPVQTEAQRQRDQQRQQRQAQVAAQRQAKTEATRHARLAQRKRILQMDWQTNYRPAQAANEQFMAANPEASVFATPFKRLYVNPVTNRLVSQKRMAVTQRGENGVLQHKVMGAQQLSPETTAQIEMATHQMKVGQALSHWNELFRLNPSAVKGQSQTIRTGGLSSVVHVGEQGAQVMSDMEKTMEHMFSYIDRHMAMWALLSVGIYGTADAFHHAADEVMRFQLEMARIQQMGTGVPYMQTFNSLMNVATSYGESVSNATKVMSQFIAMGYPTKTAVGLTNQSMLASNLSGVAPHEAANAIISSQYQFGLHAYQAPQLVNMWASVFQHSGVPVSGLMEGSAITGQGVADLNMNNPKITPMQSASETAAMVAEAVRSTNLTPNAASQVLKYIMNNLDTTNTNEILAQFGIGQYNAKTGNPLGAFQMMTNISGWMQHATPESQLMLTRALTGYGGRRAAAAQQVLKNFNPIMNGTGMMSAALNPGNSALEQNQLIMSTVIKSVEQVDKAFEHLTISLANPMLLHGIAYVAKGATGTMQFLSSGGVGGAVGQALAYYGLARGAGMAWRFANNLPTLHGKIMGVRGAIGKTFSGEGSIASRYRLGASLGPMKAMRYSVYQSGIMGKSGLTKAEAMAAAPATEAETLAAAAPAAEGVAVGATAGEATAGIASLGAMFGGLAAAILPVVIALGALAAVIGVVDWAVSSSEKYQSAMKSAHSADTALAYELHNKNGQKQFRSQWAQAHHLSTLHHLNAAQTVELNKLKKELTVTGTETIHTPTNIRFGGPLSHKRTIIEKLWQMPYQEALKQAKKFHLSKAQLSALKALNEASTVAPSIKLAQVYQGEFNTALQVGQSAVQGFASQLQITQDAFLGATQSVGYFAQSIQGIGQQFAATSSTAAMSAPFLAIEGQNYQKIMGSIAQQIHQHGAKNFLGQITQIEKLGTKAQQGHISEAYTLYEAMQKAAPAYFQGIQQLDQLKASLASLYKQMQLLHASLVVATTDMQAFTFQMGELSSVSQMAQGQQQALIPSPATFGQQIRYGSQSFGSSLVQMALAQQQLTTTQAVMQHLGVNRMSANQLANPTTWQQQAGANLVQQQNQLQSAIGQLAPQITTQYENLLNLTLSAQGYEGVWQDIVATFSIAQNALIQMKTTQDQLIANATSNAMSEQFFGSQFNVPGAMMQQASQGRSSYANIATQIAQAMATYGSNMQLLDQAIKSINAPGGQLTQFVNAMSEQVVKPEQAIAEMNQGNANGQLKAAQQQYAAAVEQVKAANAMAGNTSDMGKLFTQMIGYFSAINPLSNNPKNYNGQVPVSFTGGSSGLGATEQNPINTTQLANIVGHMATGNMPALGRMVSLGQKHGASMSQVVQGLQYYAGTKTPIYAGTSVTAWAPLIGALSKQYGVDPNVIAAIMQQESKGYAYAVSPTGNGIGLMQIDARSHPNYFAANENPFLPVANIGKGIQIFKQDLQAEGGNVTKALAAYNAGQHNIQAGYGYANSVTAIINQVKNNPAIQTAFAKDQNMTPAQIAAIATPPSISTSTSTVNYGSVVAQLTAQQANQLKAQQLQNMQIQALMLGNQSLYEKVGTYVQQFGGTASTYGIAPTSPLGKAYLAHNELMNLSSQSLLAQSSGNPNQVTQLQTEMQAIVSFMQQLGPQYLQYANLKKYPNQLQLDKTGVLANTPTGAEAIAQVNAELQNLEAQAMAIPSTMQGLQIALKGAGQAFMGFGDYTDYAAAKLSAIGNAITTFQQDLQQGLINPQDIPSVQQLIHDLQINQFSTQVGQSFASALSSGMSSALQGNVTAPASFMNSFRQAIASQISSVLSSRMMATPAMQSLMHQLGMGLGASAYGNNGTGNVVYDNLVKGTNYFVQQIQALFTGQKPTQALSSSTSALSQSAGTLAQAATTWNTNNITSLLVQAQNQGFAMINQMYSLFGPVLAQIGNNTYNAPQGFKVSPFLYKYSSSQAWAPIPGSGMSPSLGFVGGTTNAQGSTVYYGSPGIGASNNLLTASGGTSSTSTSKTSKTTSTSGLSNLLGTGISSNVQALQSNTNALSALEEAINQLMGITTASAPTSTGTKTGSASSSSASPQWFDYRIQSGNTLWALAQKYHTSVSAIEALNRGINPTDLQIGQTIKIPKLGTGGHVLGDGLAMLHANEVVVRDNVTQKLEQLVNAQGGGSPAQLPDVHIHFHGPVTDAPTLKQQVTAMMNEYWNQMSRQTRQRQLQITGRTYG